MTPQMSGFEETISLPVDIFYLGCQLRLKTDHFQRSKADQPPPVPNRPGAGYEDGVGVVRDERPIQAGHVDKPYS